MLEYPFNGVYYDRSSRMDFTGGPLKKWLHHCDPAPYPKESTTQGLEITLTFISLLTKAKPFDSHGG